MRLAIGTIILALAGCAADPALDDGTSAAAIGEAESEDPIPRSELPEARAFVRWTDQPSLVVAPRPQDAERVEVACADKQLFPTHPSSDRKTYHRAAYGRYDHFKLTGDSPACRLANAQNRCLAPDDLHYVVLSDTYEDACGNLYRGFWAETFFARDETMGTLMSRGRTVYPVPNAEFAGEVYDAATYAVAASDMLFVSPLRAGDAAAIEQARARTTTAGTHRYDAATHLWTYIGPNR